MKTAAQWNDILVQCQVRPFTAAKWAPIFSQHILNDTFSAGVSEIDDFLGQILHESGQLEHLEENLNYGAEALVRVWPTRFSAATAADYARDPVRIANKVYGGRLGNTELGDGWKYRGRGLIQCTGKDNYAAVGKAIGQDMVNNPDLLAQPEYALLSAIAWWELKIPDALIGDTIRISKAVNGGTVGLEHRISLTEKAGDALA